jgi:hypothetical protein
VYLWTQTGTLAAGIYSGRIHGGASLLMALFFATLNRHLLLVDLPIVSGPVLSGTG